MPDKILYVAGTGPMMDEMQAYVSTHNMKNVRFLGYLQKEEMTEKFYNAKAVIMTSQCYEAFAMTIAEAYSYGVPVIAGRVGNMDGMVQEGVTGVKFEYNSIEDLARKVCEFEQMDLNRLKENAREFYQHRLRPEDNYQKLISIYHSISEEKEQRKKRQYLSRIYHRHTGWISFLICRKTFRNMSFISFFPVQAWKTGNGVLRWRRSNIIIS